MHNSFRNKQLRADIEEAMYNEREEELYPGMKFELLNEMSVSSRSSPDYIKWAQSTINRALGLRLTVDGRIGPMTRSAIRSFQKQSGLVADGILGQQTERALISVGGSGSHQAVAPPAPMTPPIPGTNWAMVPTAQRILYVMELLINQYSFPVNGASGLVGNLLEESSLIPNRVEGSQAVTPMRSKSFSGQQIDFSPTDIMNRNTRTGVGPKLPGIGIAQWTSPNRRSGLFQHQFQGLRLGASILFNMDAQVDYLVNELRTNYSQVYNLIRVQSVSVNDASDEVVYRFEVPGSVLSTATPRQLLPRNNAQVQAIFARRRRSSQLALSVYKNAHP